MLCCYSSLRKSGRNCLYVTSGLRRTADVVRGILERTRCDLTIAVRQRDLERKLDEFESRL
jgi:translin